MINQEKIQEKERELVIARLEVLSPKMYFSSGNSSTTVSRDSMIKLIREKNKIGNDFVKIELEFLRALKNGDLMKVLVS